MSASLFGGPFGGPGYRTALHLPYRNGVWYGTDIGSGVRLSDPLPTDTVFFFPLFIEFPTPMKRIATGVGTSVAGAVLRLGLYANRTDGVLGPGKAVITSMDEYDMGLTTHTIIAFNFNTPVQLPRGIYWGAARGGGSAAPQPYVVNINQTVSATFTRHLGGIDPRRVYFGGAGLSFTGVSAPLTYTDPWPDMAPNVTVINTTPGSVVIAWRRD
jgi:hypothetical protein